MNPTQASPGQVAKDDRLYAVAFQGYLLKDSITEDKARALHYLEHAQVAYGANPDNYSLVDLGPGVTREMPDEASPDPGPSVRTIVPSARETAGEFEGHTREPWHVAVNTNTGSDEIEVLGHNDCCCVASGLGDGPEAEANARLIAAAPTLLAERDSLRAQLDAATDALRQRTEQRDAAIVERETLRSALATEYSRNSVAGIQRDTLRAALEELRSYADLKLQGHRQDYPEDHCMVQTALRMIALDDAALAAQGGAK